jgi:hypothetical protein
MESEVGVFNKDKVMEAFKSWKNLDFFSVLWEVMGSFKLWY